MLSSAEVYLPRSTPEQQRVSSAAILEFVQAVERQIRLKIRTAQTEHSCYTMKFLHLNIISRN